MTHAHARCGPLRAVESSDTSIELACAACGWAEIVGRCQGIDGPGRQCHREADPGYQTCALHAGDVDEGRGLIPGPPRSALPRRTRP